MLKKIKSCFTKVVKVFSDFFFEEESENNTYCIPCKWTISGSVYVNAPDVEVARAYVETHRIPPEFDKCTCYNTIPDSDHIILCICGNCNNEYMVSPIHKPSRCPYCGKGGDIQ